MENKIKKYLILSISSLIVIMVSIEILLFLGGKIFLFSQEREYGKNLKNSENYRILCIGDSTTAIGGEGSWPSQLANLLNQSNKKAVVINRGIILADSGKMSDELEAGVDKYRPNMVILMGGINDAKKARKEKNYLTEISDFFSNFRAYRLIRELGNLAKNKNEKYILTEEIYENRNLIQNFQKIQNLSENKGIIFVAMQYPLRRIEPLKNIFPNGNIIFVDNENNFKEALSKTNYEDLFVDNFGGDFGHGTKSGNLLIAKNIFEKIESIINE
jgi:lysophospholipase L1-like esterase